MNASRSTADWLQALQEAGAPQRDPLGWHHIGQLAARAGQQSAPVQALLEHRLRQALADLAQRLGDSATAPLPAANPPSPLALLLQEMGHAPDGSPMHPAPQPLATLSGQTPWRSESARVRQLRRQLRHISVHKQLTQAMAQGPQNAGPINSHMLVLRALGLMRERSPDYLNRFMTQVDTLLCLEDAERQRQQARKTPAPRHPKN